MGKLTYQIVDDYAIGIFENGKEMLIDVNDLDTVSKLSWHIDSIGYPYTVIKRCKVRLHIFLLGKPQKGLVTDHINRNKLDNRRRNLRRCTQRENTHNSPIRSNNKSGVTGVYYDKKLKQWRAQIQVEGKSKHLGGFKTLEDAVKTRKQAELKYYKKGCDYYL